MNRERRWLLRLSATLNLLLLTYILNKTSYICELYSPPTAGVLPKEDEDWPSDSIEDLFTKKEGTPATEPYIISTSTPKPRPSSPPSKNRDPQKFFIQKGEYWVAYNKIRASRTFYENESITLTTPTDYPNLYNLITIVQHWGGPISVAVYAPGKDYGPALRAIHYLRSCTTPLISQLVTFHLFFPQGHVPPRGQILYSGNSGRGKEEICGNKPTFGSKAQTYHKRKSLSFPINVARNIARESALTHFVFPSDIELYPSPGIIPDFFGMLQSSRYSWLHNEMLKVFVLPVFELESSVRVYPRDKRELLSLINKNLSFPFHLQVCRKCHNIPNLDEWISSTQETRMGIFATAYRRYGYATWEPFYIGTKDEPVFDERVTWEGKSNKRIQAYTMCVLGYQYHILNNAFLVHRPGIKVYPKEAPTNLTAPIFAMNDLINRTIIPEIKTLYGGKPGCRI